MTTKQIQAMQAGRERKRQERRSEAQSRIDAFNDWLKKDAAFHASGRQGERPAMAPVPSKNDYELVGQADEQLAGDES